MNKNHVTLYLFYLFLHAFFFVFEMHSTVLTTICMQTTRRMSMVNFEDYFFLFAPHSVSSEGYLHMSSVSREIAEVTHGDATRGTK